MRLLVVHCHPDPESYNTALYRAACEALRAAGHELRCIDLYAEREAFLARARRELAALR